jgi:hypothetical protein
MRASILVLGFAAAATFAACSHATGFEGDDASTTSDASVPFDAPTFSPDASTDAPAPFQVDPQAEQDITVSFGQKTPTVAYSASANKAPVSVAWAVDRGEVGTMDNPGPSSASNFVPSGTTGGLVDVSASYENATVTRTVLVKLTGSQNGATGNESGQVATNTTQLLSGGGIGGVGGEGLGGAVTDQPTLNALASPSGTGATQNLKFIYPYDVTVWPRGLLAPLLMWDWTIGDADAIKIDLTTTSGSFSWSGTFARPTILQQSGGNFIRHPIPQDVWEMATNTAGGVINGTLDRLTMSITLAKNGQGYGPISQTWTVAPGTLKGTVYYGAYGTKYGQSVWGVGAGTLAITHGATAPKMITPTTQCTQCHTLSASGNALVADYDNYPGNGADYDWFFDLKNNATTTNLPQVNGQFSWGAPNPNGSMLFSNSAPAFFTNPGTLEGATNAPTTLYSLPNGTAVTTSAQITSQLGLTSALGGALPVFSPDGKHVAFNFFQGGPGSDSKSADQKSLAVVDFDGVSKFSNLRTIYTPTCAGCTAVWSFFTPNSDALIFELETVNNGYFAETTSMNGSSSTDCTNLAGAHGELWWVDLATKNAHRLDVANGSGYLPTGTNQHTDDTTLQYEPTVAPIASGGYLWVAFTSRRLYGSVATLNPWCSAYSMPVTNTSPTTKKVWVAAFDENGKPGTDPSHPAFYLPAQELLAANARSYWVLDPCESDGTTCESGDECCGGYCISGEDGGLVCGSTPKGCAGEGDKCTTSSDCCGGLSCTGGHCDTTPVN